MSTPESSENLTNSTKKGKRQKPVPSFMSMTWLRVHMKKIIIAVIVTFVVSLFFIGYGTRFENANREKAEEEVKNNIIKENEKKYALSDALTNKLKELGRTENDPVVYISYNNGNASLTTTIDVKTINRYLKNNNNYEKIQQLPEGYRNYMLGSLKESVINRITMENLVELFARLNNIVGDNDVENAINEIKRNNLPKHQNDKEMVEKEFEFDLLRNNTSLIEYKNELSRSLAVDRVTKAVIKPVRPASATEDFLNAYYEYNKNCFKKNDEISFDHLLVSPSDFADSINIEDGDISAYYESNKDEFKSSKRADVLHIFIKTDDEHIASMAYSESDILNKYNEVKSTRYTDPEQVKASHILIKPIGEGDDEKRFEEAKKVILELLEKVKNGEDFAKLAKEKSDDPGSKENGGELGFFGRGEMVKEFEDAAFSTEVGSITEPIRTSYGYHIIKVEEKKPEVVKSFEEVKDELIKETKQKIANDLANSELNKVYQSLANTMSEDEFIKIANRINGASASQSCKLPAFFKGELTPDYSDSDRELLKNEICDGDNFIVPEIEEKIFAMENRYLPAISEIIKTEKGYHLFYVKSFADPIVHKLNDTIKGRIKEKLQYKKANEEAQKIAESLVKDNPSANIEEMAKIYGKEKAEKKHSYTGLEFSGNCSSAYSDLGGNGLYSDNGRTYLPEFHKSLLDATKAKNLNVYLQPFKTRFGWNIVKITDYKTDRYENFVDVRDTIRRIATLEPSDAEMNKLYEETKDQYNKPATRTIRQIVCDKATAEKVIKELNEGALFSMLANQYSKDGYSNNGGLMPPAPKGNYDTNLDEVVWNLKVNEYTKEPVKINDQDYVVALLVKETPEVKGNFSLVANQLKATLQRKNVEEAWTYFMKGLMNQANIVRVQEVIDLIE